MTVPFNIPTIGVEEFKLFCFLTNIFIFLFIVIPINVAKLFFKENAMVWIIVLGKCY